MSKYYVDSIEDEVIYGVCSNVKTVEVASTEALESWLAIAHDEMYSIMWRTPHYILFRKAYDETDVLRIVSKVHISLRTVEYYFPTYTQIYEGDISGQKWI